MFFEVIPTEVFRNDGGILTYSSEIALKPGQIVLIPLGKKTVTGIVWQKVPSVDFPTKPISKLLSPIPLPKHLLRAIFWLSQYYLTPIPLVANLLIPAGLTSRNALKGYLEPQEGTLRQKSHPIALKAISLNLAQKKALETISGISGNTKLLRGVTGSGKTNIYLQLTTDTLQKGQSAILLVPEIALTSQLVKVFEQTFGENIALIHSKQTLAEKRQTWLKILSTNAPQVIIGPRSALLSPVQNLGLIIIDEAHENAYYQENPPRYSALRLASFMAHCQQMPCILGSATPTLVDYYLAKTKHTLVGLDQKAKNTAVMPSVQIVDLKKREDFLHNRYFSNQLLTSIEKNIKDRHQTLIFHNRRGSAPLTICEECGWQALCPECFLPMTLHNDSYILTCHICGHEEKVPSSCPNCQHTGIIHKGFGTKLLEMELKQHFPKAKIARFDGDNNKNDDLASLYNSVKDGEIEILIGTQTLAKGLDLPHLATVGIVQADAGLALPDFAAEERTFELLTQVIGRVGRGHLDQAEVIIQSYQPEHPVIQAAISADYPGFAEYLLKQRRTQQMPPFAYLARLTSVYKTEKTALAKIQQAYNSLSKNPSLELSPPMPAFHERTSRGYVWQLIIKSTSRESLRKSLLPFRNSQYTITLDPPSLL